MTRMMINSGNPRLPNISNLSFVTLSSDWKPQTGVGPVEISEVGVPSVVPRLYLPTSTSTPQGPS
jgi:hypothetical protein